MVSTRRASKKAKLHQEPEPAVDDDDIVQDMEIDDNDDFQDPLPTLPSVRVTRSSKNKGKAPLLRSDSTQSLRSRVQRLRVAESSSASPTTSNSSTGRWSLRNSPSSTTVDEEDVLDNDIFSSIANSAVGSSTPVSLTEFDSGTQQVSLNEQEVDQLLQEYEEEDSSTSEEESNDSDSSSDSEEDTTTVTRRRRQPVNRRRRIPTYESTRLKILSQHKELEKVWDDLEKIKPDQVVPIEQPPDLHLPLLSFQRYGVGWMLQQESLKDFNGGILADEMGMGKTIQTIALLLSDKKKPNLVIAPTVAIMQWKSEIEKHTNNALSVCMFHGAKREKDPNVLKKFDIVLSTYSIMESSFRLQEHGRKNKTTNTIHKDKSVLHNIHWHRVILDEAHNIKDRSCNTARSVFNLQGKFKWSLTGTPLQNRVGELYSLIRFMQADPFAYYYCKGCPCKQLSWKFSDKRTCDSCGHTPMSHVCWWNNEVLRPIQQCGYTGDGREALKKLKLLLNRIMLRRTKIQCADDLGLPPRTVVVRRDIFSEEEEDFYRSLYSDVSRQFTSYVEQGTVLNNYANIFELLMKMRQCADHPDLVTKKSTDNMQLVCMLCNDPPEDAVAAACKHVFCRECCVQYYNSFDDENGDERPRCPSCFTDFSVDLTQPALEVEDAIGGGTGANANYAKSSIVNRINMDKWRSSTKIEALVEELSKLRREDKTIKSIVFSQFVNFLDLVYWRLSRAGFECIRLDGTMSPERRDAAIKHFMTKPSCTVFLISLKAGGVALNLTEASRVFICDPWWNPASELQAMDRIHRLGQYRPIRITRLIIENSIESRIVQLQDKKTALVESTVDGNSSALDKLTVDDLRFLFVM